MVADGTWIKPNNQSTHQVTVISRITYVILDCSGHAVCSSVHFCETDAKKGGGEQVWGLRHHG